jgi:ABC-type Zn uptake system ZnuABC Zn-binding protein ZnuA
MKQLTFEELTPVRFRAWLYLSIAAMAVACLFAGCSDRSNAGGPKNVRVIVASDTILSGMIASLLPPRLYAVAAILPPGQCPGHYDVKLSDAEKMKRADLIVSFKEMSFIDKNGPERAGRLVIDTGGRNWMAPDSYIHGLDLLADRLSKYFPEDKNEILSRRDDAVREVRAYTDSVKQRIRDAGIAGKAVIASSMQKEPLEWMGFCVAGEYGRPESLSAREVVHLAKTGKEQGVIFVADNLQSGPDAGRGIAESLGVPHIVLTNFPSEKGYLVTLGENVDIILAAAAAQKAGK